MLLEAIVLRNTVLTEAQVIADPELVRQIQTRLSELNWYPPHAIDGKWGAMTRKAIADFCKSAHLDNDKTGSFGASFAKALINAKTLEVKPEVITKILKCPLGNVSKYLPGIIAALKEQGIYSRPTLIGAIATIGVETPNFAPIREIGSVGYFTKHYEGREDLGNHQKGDGARFCGRGFIQITGRANYKFYGERLNLDLIANPDLALDPETGARILALYFKTRGIQRLCAAGLWQKVRRAVNGGTNGLDRFMYLVGELQKYV